MLPIINNKSYNIGLFDKESIMDDEKIIVLFEDNPSLSHILESFIKLYFKKNKKI